MFCQVCLHPLLHCSRLIYKYSITFCTLRDGSHSTSFRIPWTKTTKEAEAQVILTRCNDALCPCRAMRNHIDVNNNIPGFASLFAYQTTEGHWEHMSKHNFMSFCVDIWSSAGLAHVKGHSFRIGGAVELLLAGVPPEIVAQPVDGLSLLFSFTGAGWKKSSRCLRPGLTRSHRSPTWPQYWRVFDREMGSQLTCWMHPRTEL